VIANLAEENKATDIVVMDVADLVGYTSYFVLCTGRSSRQVRAIADNVRADMKTDHGMLPIGVEGLQGGRWVLADFDEVVLHVFDQDARSFFNLDDLWADAPVTRRTEGTEEEDEEEPLFTLPS